MANDLMEIIRQASEGKCVCLNSEEVCGYCVIETAKAILNLRPSYEAAIGKEYRSENKH